MTEVAGARSFDVEAAEQAAATVREQLIREAVSYDDICRYWRREQSVRIRVLAGMVEALGTLCRGESLQDSVSPLGDPALLERCHAILSLVHRDMARLVGQPWPNRETEAEGLNS